MTPLTPFEWFLSAVALIALYGWISTGNQAVHWKSIAAGWKTVADRQRDELADLDAIAAEAVTRASDPMYRAMDAELTADVYREFADIVEHFTVTDDREG